MRKLKAFIRLVFWIGTLPISLPLIAFLSFFTWLNDQPIDWPVFLANTPLGFIICDIMVLFKKTKTTNQERK